MLKLGKVNVISFIYFNMTSLVRAAAEWENMVLKFEQIKKNRRIALKKTQVFAPLNTRFARGGGAGGGA